MPITTRIGVVSFNLYYDNVYNFKKTLHINMKYDQPFSDRCPGRSFYIIWMSGECLQYNIVYTTYLLYYSIDQGWPTFFGLKSTEKIYFPLRID